MMKRFKNILVIVDAQDATAENKAIQRSVELAGQSGAALTFLTVFDEPETSIKQYEDFISANELTELLKKNKLAALEAIVKPLRNSNFQVDTLVAVGRGFIEIIRLVLRNNFDVVIKVAELRNNILRSNDTHLVRKCPCPVWLIRDDMESKSILAAIDLKLQDTEQGKAMNKLIMDISANLANRDNAKLYLMSCWTLYGEDALRNSGFLKVSDGTLQAMLATEQSVYQWRQKTLANQYNLPDENLVLKKGKPDEEIPAFVESQKISTVIMGTVGRTGVPGLIIGNTAESVLGAIRTSVIAVKPDGFVSPVKQP